MDIRKAKQLKKKKKQKLASIPFSRILSREAEISLSLERTYLPDNWLCKNIKHSDNQVWNNKQQEQHKEGHEEEEEEEPIPGPPHS